MLLILGVMGTTLVRPAPLLAQISTPTSPPERTLNRWGEVELRTFKQQPIQNIAVTGGGIFDVDDTLNSSHLELSVSTGIPLGSFDNLLGLRPGVRIDFIDAEPGIDVPEELYEFSLPLLYRRKMNERLTLTGIVAPSVRSDLSTSENAVRVIAVGLLSWEYIPDTLTLSGGVVSLGRADLPVLPAIGLRWTPSPTTRLDLQFPISKLARRLSKDGGDSETWSYLSAGIGGNTWAVKRADGSSDELSLGDIRLFVGIERLADGGGRCFLETGALFSRDLEFENDDSKIDLGNGVLIRGGWRY